MKTAIQFLTENWWLALIWNLPLITLLSIPLSNIFNEAYKILSISIALWLYISLNSIKNWYNDYKFDELEKQIKELNK